MTTPIVEVIIPVHDPRRAIDRAAGSIVRSASFDEAVVRVTVICHNVAIDDVIAQVSPDIRSRIRFLSLSDGIPSPAGPFTYGIDQSQAEFVSIMGSDDWLDDGAIISWIAAARDRRADVIIAPQRHRAGSRVRTPPMRPFRSGRLDPFRDRLVYRTAPLGLMRRELVAELGLVFPAHLKNGSDQIFSLMLWYSRARCFYPRTAPSYVVGDDAPSRVTTAPRVADEELRAIEELVTNPFFDRLDLASRRAIAAKVARVHLFSGALVRSLDDRWTADDRRTFVRILSTLERQAPGYRRLLSWADLAVLTQLSTGSASSSKLLTLLRRRARFGRPSTVLTPDLRGLFSRHGPARLMVASRLL